jgi:hypothetical protein
MGRVAEEIGRHGADAVSQKVIGRGIGSEHGADAGEQRLIVATPPDEGAVAGGRFEIEGAMKERRGELVPCFG